MSNSNVDSRSAERRDDGQMEQCGGQPSCSYEKPASCAQGWCRHSRLLAAPGASTGRHLAIEPALPRWQSANQMRQRTARTTYCLPACACKIVLYLHVARGDACPPPLVAAGSAASSHPQPPARRPPPSPSPASILLAPALSNPVR